MKHPPDERNPDSGPTVIAIGASAGGLEPFFQLLEDFEPADGVALVYLQHRTASPGQDRLLSLLGSRTSMAVEAVEEGRVLEGNRVYVAPAGKKVAVRNGRFRLEEPGPGGSVRHPIDALFRSLAEDR
ncbi:MAG TPA: chemotaxis protein CheB, partial [Gammaproteobacteria bacterium]|nr:chemotaxis protein CheB [Gammaproteobacteria bacterium]